MRGRVGRAGVAPTLALLVGVAAAAVLAPLVVDEGSDASSPTDPIDAPSLPTTTVPAPSTAAPAPTEAPPTSTPTTAAASVVRVRIVPAVRDVGVLVEGIRYDSDADGLIEAPVGTSGADVTVVGYSVTPAFQQVAFTGWEDGSTETSRTLPATDEGDEVELGVRISYRVTARGTSEPVVLRDDDGVALALTSDAPTWVAAAQAGTGPDGGLVARDVGYTVEVGGRARSERFTPTPEARLDLG